MVEEQFLPPGPFDSDLLRWKLLKWYGTTYQVAHIPADREKDFVKGEGLKYTTTFWVTYTQASKSEGSIITEKRAYRCAFGPEDNSDKLPLDEFAGPREKGQRRKRKEHGQSIKVGCRATFTAVFRKDHPEICEIRYTETGRMHCKPDGSKCHGPGCLVARTAQLAPRLSDNLKARVAELLMQDLSTTDIVKQIQQDHQQAFMIRHGLASLEEAALAMTLPHAEISRDYLITLVDVRNIGNRMRGRTSAIHRDCSVAENCEEAAQPCEDAAQPCEDAIREKQVALEIETPPQPPDVYPVVAQVDQATKQLSEKIPW